MKKRGFPNPHLWVGNPLFVLWGVELPNGLVNIGEFAFFDCVSMKSITIPRSVKEIGKFSLGYTKTGYGEGIEIDEPNTVVTRGYKIEGFTIYGAANSAAQTYAKENGFDFVPIVTIMKGDVDGSGKVDSADLRLVLKAVCKKVELTEEQKEAADVDNEGNGVDAQDMRKILRYVCGKITEF